MGKIRILFFQSIAIVVYSAVIGLIFNWISLNHLPLIAAKYTPIKSDSRIITLEDAKKSFDEANSVFIDARRKDYYVNGHIPGALNFYAEEFGAEEEESIIKFFPSHTMIITYCDGGECELSRRLADRLEEMGYIKVKILVVGWNGWEKAGYPVER